MAQHLKNNKTSTPDAGNVQPICQTKFSKKLQSKEMKERNHSQSNEGNEKLKHKICKRMKRVGVWVLSFVSSFLCGAFVAFVLWWTQINIGICLIYT